MQPDTARERRAVAGVAGCGGGRHDRRSRYGSWLIEAALPYTYPPPGARRPPAPDHQRRGHKKRGGVWWIHTTKHPTSMGPKTKGKKVEPLVATA